MKNKIVAALLCAIAGQAFGSGTITNGNASLTIVGQFDSNLGNANMLTDPGAPDQLFQLGWYYRTQNNNQNSVFSLLDTPIQTYVGNTATFTWTNAGPGAVGNERFNATLTIVLEDGSSPDELKVTQTMVFTASAANTANRTYQVFNLMDLDIGGTPADDSTVMSNLPSNVATWTQPGASLDFGSAQGLNATNFEVNTGGGLRAKMAGGSSNFNNTTGPVIGDGAAGFQWTLALAPGQSQTLVSKFTINKPLPDVLCYPNCDGSTSNPVLTANDFQCFLNAYSAGLLYANCDGSTSVPALTANDFQCFLNAYATGCP